MLKMALELRTEPCFGKAATGSPVIAAGYDGTRRGYIREDMIKRSGNTLTTSSCAAMHKEIFLFFLLTLKYKSIKPYIPGILISPLFMVFYGVSIFLSVFMRPKWKKVNRNIQKSE